MNINQRAGAFGTNKVNVGGGGLVGVAGVVFAGVLAMGIAAIVGAAIATMLIVLGATAAGCMVLKTVHRCGLEWWHLHRTGQLPPPRAPFVTITRPVEYQQIEAPPRPAGPWSETRVWRADER
jgi:hypothetical protein